MIDKLINLDMPVHINAGDIPAAIAELPRLVHQRDDARAEVARLTAELAAERETVARLREEVALLNAHINKRNADDFHALAEHQHEVNTLRARIEAGIAAAHEGREEIIAAVNSIPFGERLDKIVAALRGEG